MKEIFNRLKNIIYISIISPIIFIFKNDVKLGKEGKIIFPTLIKGDVILDDYSYISPYCQGNFSEGNKLRIGKFCSIGSGVEFICGTNHDYNKLTTFPTTLLGINHNITDSIEIGHDVWIGRNAIILKGRKIGTGSVIGAGSVVTKDIPPYAIVGGNPARIIKYRFDDKTIKKLLESERWNRDLEKIKNNYNLEFIKNN